MDKAQKIILKEALGRFEDIGNGNIGSYQVGQSYPCYVSDFQYICIKEIIEEVIESLNLLNKLDEK